MSRELERFAAFYRRQIRAVSLPGKDVRRIWLRIKARLQAKETRDPAGTEES